MDNKNFGKFSRGAFPSSTSTFSRGFVGTGQQKQIVSKLNLNENKTQVLPRRRSRLGTRPSLMRNQELPSYNDTNNYPRINSQKKVQSNKKPAPVPIMSSTPEDCFYQNGVNKRLFSRSPISRRLNMDTSSIIQSSDPSSENQDPEVTGVCYIGDATNTNKKNRKNNDTHLRSANKLSTPSRYFLAKSPFPSASKSAGKKLNYTVGPSGQFLGNNQVINKSPPSPPKSLYLRNRLRQTIESPKMPKTFLSKNCSKQIIESPKLPSSTLAVLAAIKKRHALSNIDNNISSNNSCLNAGYKMSEVNLDFPKTSEADDKDAPVSTEFVSARLPGNKFGSSESANNNSTSSVINKSQSINCNPDNSLEVASTRVNGTYDIIDTSSKMLESNASHADGGTAEAVGLTKNNEYIQVEEHYTILNVKSTPADRSPSFVVFSKKSEKMYDLDDSTATFIYQESICNESTIITNKGETTIKKLSTIAEDITLSVDNPPSTSSTCQCNNSLLMNSLSNLYDFIEKSKSERELFLQTVNKFVVNERNFHSSVNNCLNEIKDLMRGEGKCNNDFDNALKTLENKMKSAHISAAVLQTPDHSRKTVSKSVYNDLKTEYSCLKTPKASTMKKCKSYRKILTPHSMSLCVQDQVDQLFDT